MAPGRVVFRWLRFQVESDDAQAAVACLRVRLQAAFQAWCLNGGQRMPPVLQKALAVMTEVFSVEGATGSELLQRRGRAGRCDALPEQCLPACFERCSAASACGFKALCRVPSSC